MEYKCRQCAKQMTCTQTCPETCTAQVKWSKTKNYGEVKRYDNDKSKYIRRRKSNGTNRR